MADVLKNANCSDVSKGIMSAAEKSVLHTYNRFPVVIDRGDGVRVTDVDGKEYLDFMSGIGVFALGYHFPGYDEALIRQIGKTIHTSNLYYHRPLAEAAAALTGSLGMSAAFFTNSGAEAVEGAIKAARKYAFLKDDRTDHEIIAMNSSFHGRTAGALAVTGNEAYQAPFRPLMGGIRFADFNDIESVMEQVNDRTSAVILETLQGEGGIFPADESFIEGLAKLQKERDILIIADEIQCGMGRTGKMWAFENYDIKPDIVTCAKALGCGIPVGAFVLNEKVASSSLVPGDHGTTYGGNPLAAAAVAEVFRIFDKYDIAKRASDAGAYLAGKLDELMAGRPYIKAHRGMGLMRGLELDESVKASDVVRAALGKGLLIITAGHNVIRFLPPLIMRSKDIDEGIEKLAEAMDEAASSGA